MVVIERQLDFSAEQVTLCFVLFCFVLDFFLGGGGGKERLEERKKVTKRNRYMKKGEK